MILDNFHRVRLIDQPTALQRQSRIEALNGHQSLWVKRDDAILLGQGGNKLRSLEFWLGEARAQSCDIVLVAGKSVSNMCRAAAAKTGLDCLILHNDDEPVRREGNFLLSHLYGASFQFLGPIDEDERAVKLREAAEDLRRRGRRPYIVGDSVTGALGYVQGAFELHQQAEDMGPACAIFSCLGPWVRRKPVSSLAAHCWAALSPCIWFPSNMTWPSYGNGWTPSIAASPNVWAPGPPPTTDNGPNSTIAISAPATTSPRPPPWPRSAPSPATKPAAGKHLYRQTRRRDARSGREWQPAGGRTRLFVAYGGHPCAVCPGGLF